MFKKRLLSASRQPYMQAKSIGGPMTLPDERYRAVVETQKFLAEILFTPRVPKAIKAQAGNLLRHYPNAYDMRKAAQTSPDIFQEQMEDLHRFVLKGQLEQQEREEFRQSIKDQ